ncbi:MAG: relaxase/mobilization nuclease domain-containing protein [Alphaproteobacteria bacterium]|nr:relaxase/mobilization nuclease domain-containing protein [Alphaproteobacteria bacterium]
MPAWNPDEDPLPARMQELARRTLELAELADHQAVVVGHGDTAHRHLHMLINRVHPQQFDQRQTA